LLEDDSPALMARIARMKRQPDLDKLLDQPDKPASRKTAKGKKHQPT